MVTLKNLLATTSLLAFAGSAQAVIIDFVELAEVSLGESGWSTLALPGADLSITAKKGTADAFAYLDYGHAGLGVCGELYAGKEGFQSAGSRTNVCNPSSDDNVTGDAAGVESLIFTFTADVTINRIWFNNTHDRDRHIGGPGHEGDFVNINGVPVAGPGNGYAPGPSSYNGIYSSSEFNFLGPYFADSSSADSRTLTIAFNNQQFYISAMEVTPGVPDEKIPVPGVLSLFGLGLLGLGYSRRRTV